MAFTITLIIVIITTLISISAFSQGKVYDDFIFYPPAISGRGQWYRFITHGLIHADPMHLLFNMFALYSFGGGLEKVLGFSCVFGRLGGVFFLVLYVTALVVASLPDYFKYRNAHHFRSLGASGAVSAVVFSMIVFFPQSEIGIIFLPGIRIPGYIFGVVYLAISVYLDRRGGGNVNHSAHFWGAAYGVVFTLVACQVFARSFDVYENFLHQLKSSSDDLVLMCQ